MGESLKDDLNPREDGDDDGDDGINVTMEVNDCGKSIENPYTCTTVSLPRVTPGHLFTNRIFISCTVIA